MKKKRKIKKQKSHLTKTVRSAKQDKSIPSTLNEQLTTGEKYCSVSATTQFPNQLFISTEWSVIK